MHEFRLFSGEHLTALFLIVVSLVPFFLFKGRVKKQWLRYFFIITLLAISGYRAFYFWSDGLTLQYELPLQLCDLSTFAMLFALIWEHVVFKRILVFWGLSGGTLALLMPDLVYGFPDPQFILFFFAHVILLWIGCYFLLTKGYEATFKEALWAWGYLAIYILVMLPLNMALESNYGYLLRLPDASLGLTMLKWPYYIPMAWMMGGFFFALTSQIDRGLKWVWARVGSKEA